MKHEPRVKRVAITGVGIVSCLGIGKDAVTQSLDNMHSGIRLDSERGELGFRSALSGSVEGFAPRFLKLGRKLRKGLIEMSSSSLTLD